MPRKPTALQQEFYKEFERVQKLLAPRVNQGFIVENKGVLKSKYVWAQPQTIRRRDVERLKKITEEKIQDLTRYVDRETGEIITEKEWEKQSGINVYQLQISKSLHYQSFSKLIINTFKGEINKYEHSEARGLLLTWIDALIEDYGEDDVANMINDATNAGVIITYKVMYDGTVVQFMHDMIGYLKGSSNVDREYINYLEEQLEEGYFAESGGQFEY